MTTHPFATLSLALALLLPGCMDSGMSASAEPAQGEDEEGEEVTPDDDGDLLGISPGENVKPHAAPIPIELWVDDLVKNRTTNYAKPDTVADKVIKNSWDPALFNKYFRGAK